MWILFKSLKERKFKASYFRYFILFPARFAVMIFAVSELKLYNSAVTNRAVKKKSLIWVFQHFKLMFLKTSSSKSNSIDGGYQCVLAILQIVYMVVTCFWLGLVPHQRLRQWLYEKVRRLIGWFVDILVCAVPVVWWYIGCFSDILVGWWYVHILIGWYFGWLVG